MYNRAMVEVVLFEDSGGIVINFGFYFYDSLIVSISVFRLTVDIRMWGFKKLFQFVDFRWF